MSMIDSTSLSSPSFSPPFFSQAKPVTPLGLSGLTKSTISPTAPTEKRETLFYPPPLPSPDAIAYQSLECLCITWINHLHHIGLQMSIDTSEELQAIAAQLKTYALEKASVLEQAALKEKEAHFWSWLEKVLTCLTAAFNIALGIFLIETGEETVGGVATAAGMLSLANIALKEYNGWHTIADRLAEDFEKKEQILLWAPRVLDTISTIAGMACFAQTLTNPALISSATTGAQALKTFEIGLEISEKTTQIGHSWSDSRYHILQSQIEMLTYHMTREQFYQSDALEKITSTQKNLNSLVESVYHVLQIATNKRVTV